MAKYIKKPIPVEAFQWLGVENLKAMPKGIYSKDGKNFFVITANNVEVPIEFGDYIIYETNQNIPNVVLAYPCKREIFETTYEKVKD